MDYQKTGIFNKIKNKITNIFKPKPQTFLLGNGESLEVDGNLSKNPFYSFFNNLGSTLVDFTHNVKQNIQKSKIKNTPMVHSTSLVENPKQPQQPKNEKIGLIGQGSFINTSEKHIIPERVQDVASSTPAPPILNTQYAKTRDLEYPSTPTFTTHLSFQDMKRTISSSIRSHSRNSSGIINAYKSHMAIRCTPNKQVQPTLTVENKEKEEL